MLLISAVGPDGTGVFAVKTTGPGVSVIPERGIDKTRKQFGVELADAEAQYLGALTPDDVAAVIDDLLIATAADALGAARAVLDMAVAYAKTRTQFGAPIGSFQAVQHLCVDMYETVELARSGVVHALWASDSCPAERHLAALRAKAFAGRLATVGDTAIQVFGGIGYTWEHDAHLYLKRLLSWSALLGGPDHYLVEVGAQLAAEVDDDRFHRPGRDRHRRRTRPRAPLRTGIGPSGATVVVSDLGGTMNGDGSDTSTTSAASTPW